MISLYFQDLWNMDFSFRSGITQVIEERDWNLRLLGILQTYGQKCDPSVSSSSEKVPKEHHVGKLWNRPRMVLHTSKSTHLQTSNIVHKPI